MSEGRRVGDQEGIAPISIFPHQGGRGKRIGREGDSRAAPTEDIPERLMGWEVTLTPALSRNGEGEETGCDIVVAEHESARRS